MDIDWIKKRWFIVTALVACIGFALGGAKWATQQEANDRAHTTGLKDVRETVTRRLDRIESKLDRLIEAR